MPYDERGIWKDCECLRYTDRNCKCPCHNPYTRQHDGKFLAFQADEEFAKGYDQAICEIVEEIQQYWPDFGEQEKWPKLKEHLREKFRFIKPE